MVFVNWRSEGHAALILNDRCRLARSIEKIAGIPQGRVLVVPVGGAVVLIGSSLTEDLHLGAGVAPEFGIEIIGNYFYFLHGILAQDPSAAFCVNDLNPSFSTVTL